jgi:hypothetical protein
MTVWMPILTRTLSNHWAESVALAVSRCSQAPSLARSIAPQACPQKSRDHTVTRSDHPEFDRKCDQPPLQIIQRAVPHPLFENINHLPQVLRQYIPLHNVRRRVHHFVLVCQLGVDPAPGFPELDTKLGNMHSRTLCNV